MTRQRHPRVSHRTIAACAAAVAVVLALASSALAAPLATLKARFSPDQLRRSTTVFFGFAFSSPEPLKTMELRLPAGMTFTHSQLGLEPCQPLQLQEYGVDGCPLDSKLGRGKGFAEVPYGPLFEKVIDESANVTVLLGPITDQHMTALFWVEGIYPVGLEKIFVGTIRTTPRPFGTAIRVEVPLDQAWTEGPLVGIRRFSSTIGPAGLTYTRHENGRTIHFTPEGLDTPETCPQGGFPVAAYFTWWTGGGASAKTYVPCPLPTGASLG